MIVVVVLAIFALLDGVAGLLGVAERIGIGDGRGNDVTATGPFTEVDEATAVGAERELGFGAQHELATGGTTECGKPFGRHVNLKTNHGFTPIYTDSKPKSTNVDFDP